jgi:hypothetical protein
MYSHAGHTISPVELAIANKKKSLQEDWNAISVTLLHDLEELKTKASKYADEFHTKSIEELGRIDKFYDTLFRVLHKQQEEITTQLQSKQKHQLKSLRGWTDAVEKGLAQVSVVSQLVDAAYQEENVNRWLKVESSLRKHFEEFETVKPASFELDLPVVELASDLETFIKPLISISTTPKSTEPSFSQLPPVSTPSSISSIKSPGKIFLSPKLEKVVDRWLVCGRNDYGQLGLGHTKAQNKWIEFSPPISFSTICTGMECSVGLTGKKIEILGHY